MSALSKPQKRAHRRNARRFVAAALVFHHDHSHFETQQAALHFRSTITCTAQSAPTSKKDHNNKTHRCSFVRQVMADGNRCSWLPSKYSLFVTSAMHQQPRPNPAYRFSLLIKQTAAGSVRSRL